MKAKTGFKAAANNNKKSGVFAKVAGAALAVSSAAGCVVEPPRPHVHIYDDSAPPPVVIIESYPEPDMFETRCDLGAVTAAGNPMYESFCTLADDVFLDSYYSPEYGGEVTDIVMTLEGYEQDRFPEENCAEFVNNYDCEEGVFYDPDIIYLNVKKLPSLQKSAFSEVAGLGPLSGEKALSSSPASPKGELASVAPKRAVVTRGAFAPVVFK